MILQSELYPQFVAVDMLGEDRGALSRSKNLFF